VLTAVASYGPLHFAKHPFEYDFRKLKARIAETDSRREFGDSQDVAVRPLALAHHHPRRQASEVESVRAAIQPPGRSPSG
jgi:hypothetical protein